MKFTPADHLGAVDRTLSTVTRDGQEMRRLTVTRTYDATPDEVWDALTTAERIPRWLAPISGGLTLGGRFQIEGNAGGEIRTCVPPEQLSVTWEYGGDVSRVDATLSIAEDGTLLRLEHSAPVPPEMWSEFGPGAVGIGWEMMLMGLAEHLAAPDAPRPDPTDPALMGPLVEFMTGCSDRWREASVAAGTDPGEASAAAERCLAAYTAPPE
jgi:uncharacterized protein YndB with AHSA1/START domain